jgi:hypothetical protein
MTKMLLILISLTLLPGLALAKDKDSALERAIKDEIFDDDKQKGKGRPDNPGEHGRDNAAQKQATNPGKGGGKNSSLESAILDEILDDDDDRGDKGKDKKKKKDK